MKKLIALLLCLVMCLPLFAACGGDDPADTTAAASKPTDTTPIDPEDPGDDKGNNIVTRRTDWLNDVATNDWGGHIFKILYANTSDGELADFVCDQPNGDTLNDQVYQRNTAVEDRLNITLDVQPFSGTDYEKTLQTQYGAPDEKTDYDLVSGYNRNAIKVSLKGYLANIADYDTVNIYRPYWDQGFVDSMVIEDSLYAIVGDYSIKANLFSSSICFNKNIFKTNGLEEPYNLVKSYEWTVDKLLEYMEGFAQDLDQDGYDQDKDIFALSGWGSESSYGIFYGSGFKYIDNDGETLAIDYDRDTLDDLLDVCISVWSQNGVYFNDSGVAAQHSFPFDIFTSGRGLFCDIVLYKISMFFSDMDDDYGILPEPMFTEDQGEYFTYTGYTIPLLLIPANDHNPERTGNVMENICAASNDIVVPKMFEIVTKIQNARDEESATMIDIIISNKIYDPAHWLQLSGYERLVRYLIKERQNLSTGYIQRYGSQAESELETYLDSYAALQG